MSCCWGFYEALGFIWLGARGSMDGSMSLFGGNSGDTMPISVCPSFCEPAVRNDKGQGNYPWLGVFWSALRDSNSRPSDPCGEPFIGLRYPREPLQLVYVIMTPQRLREHQHRIAATQSNTRRSRAAERRQRSGLHGVVKIHVQSTWLCCWPP